jgi:hypothetical protein
MTQEDNDMAICAAHPRSLGALIDAVNHNCTCEFRWNLRRVLCSAHRMLVQEQRALDGLVFGRRIAGRQREEWMDSHEAATTLTGPRPAGVGMSDRTQAGPDESPRLAQVWSGAHRNLAGVDHSLRQEQRQNQAERM